MNSSKKMILGSLLVLSFLTVGCSSKQPHVNENNITMESNTTVDNNVTVKESKGSFMESMMGYGAGYLLGAALAAAIL